MLMYILFLYFYINSFVCSCFMMFHIVLAAFLSFQVGIQFRLFYVVFVWLVSLVSSCLGDAWHFLQVVLVFLG